MVIYPQVQAAMRKASIVGDEGVVCDGLSTALFVMGLEKAADLWV